MNVLKQLVKVLLFAFSFVVLLVLKLIQPIIRFQLCVVGFHRYGHLALEPEVFLAEQEVLSSAGGTPKRVATIWSFGPVAKQSNTFLASKWREELTVLPSWFISSLHKVGLAFPILRLNEPKLSITGNMNGLDKTSPHISLNADEIEDGKKQLIEMGVDPEKPYVCLIVRDGGHYKSKGETESQGYDLFNFDIDTFMPAVEHLVDEGFQVIRMGSGFEKPISETVKGLFDYACSEFRSEFLDVYIAATCEFAVSTQTGPDAVCMLFRRPVLYVDITRYSQFFFGMKCATWTPVRLFKNERLLSLSEIVGGDIAWYKDPTEFLMNGIVQQKSSPNELLRIVRSYAECNRGVSALKDHYSRMVADGMGIRGRNKFGEATAASVPDVNKILGEWVNN